MIANGVGRISTNEYLSVIANGAGRIFTYEYLQVYKIELVAFPLMIFLQVFTNGAGRIFSYDFLTEDNKWSWSHILL